MLKNTVLILLFMTIFAACSRTEQMATLPAQAAVVVTEPLLTLSPLPTNTKTAVPTPTNTSIPTDTAMPTATATITPTPTPTTAIWVQAGTPHADSAVIGVENVAQITELARWGRGVVRDIDLSADGRWLAVAAGSGAYIHDLQDFQAEPVAFEMAGDVTAVSISPTGDKIAIVIGEDELQLWQVDTVEQIFVADKVQQVQFSPDGEVLAVTKRNSSGSLELWDVRDGTVIKSYRPGNKYFPRIKFSPNGSQVAIWSQHDDTVEIYDWREDSLVDTNQAVLQSDIGAMVGDLEFLTEEELRLLVIEIVDRTFVTGKIELQNAKDNKVIFTAERINDLAEPIKYVCNEPVVFWDPPDPPVPYRMEVSPEQQIAALY